MAKPFRGVINVDVTQSVPDWGPYTQPIAPEGTPSVLYIVLDDVGYSAMGAYGGLIRSLRAITNSSASKEPKWRHPGRDLTSGYDPRWTH